MTKRHRFLINLAVLVTSIAITAEIQAANTAAVIVRSDFQLNGITRAELVRILVGDSRFWSNRVPIRIVIPSRVSPVLQAVYGNLLKTTPNDFERQWESRRFRGETTTVPTVSSEAQLAVRLVVSQRGFLAIIGADDLDALTPKLREAVKIVPIDGKLPGNAGYALTFP